MRIRNRGLTPWYDLDRLAQAVAVRRAGSDSGSSAGRDDELDGAALGPSDEDLAGKARETSRTVLRSPPRSALRAIASTETAWRPAPLRDSCARLSGAGTRTSGAEDPGVRRRHDRVVVAPGHEDLTSCGQRGGRERKRPANRAGEDETASWAAPFDRLAAACDQDVARRQANGRIGQFEARLARAKARTRSVYTRDADEVPVTSLQRFG